MKKILHWPQTGHMKLTLNRLSRSQRQRSRAEIRSQRSLRSLGSGFHMFRLRSLILFFIDLSDSSDHTETYLIWLSLFIWLLNRGYDEKMAILVKWSLLSNSQWKFYNFNIIFIIHRNWRWQNAKRGDYLPANKLKKELRQVNCQHKYTGRKNGFA